MTCTLWHVVWSMAGLGVGLLIVPLSRLWRIVRIWRRAGR